MEFPISTPCRSCFYRLCQVRHNLTPLWLLFTPFSWCTWSAAMVSLRVCQRSGYYSFGLSSPLPPESPLSWQNSRIFRFACKTHLDWFPVKDSKTSAIILVGRTSMVGAAPGYIRELPCVHITRSQVLMVSWTSMWLTMPSHAFYHYTSRGLLIYQQGVYIGRYMAYQRSWHIGSLICSNIYPFQYY